MKKKIIWGSSIGAFCLVIIVFLISLWHPVFLKKQIVEVDYRGKYQPKTNLQMVLFGNKKAVKYYGQVDVNKLGTYSCYYLYKGKKYPFNVKVVDQQAPKLMVKNYQTDLVADVKPQDFVKKVSDNKKAYLKFAENYNKAKKAGKTNVKIIAYDKSGNETEKDAQLIRKKDQQAPKFEAIPAIEITTNDQLDLLKGVVVKDNLDPHPKVTYDKKGHDFHQAGTYYLVYQAIDRSGNKATAKRRIDVKQAHSDGDKVVYLTFDDGPSANTAKILDILKKFKVKGTFFVTGNGQKYNYLIKRAYAEGNTIGLHTYTHNYQIYRSAATYYADLNQIEQMVHNLIGIKSKYIRFPGGSSNTVSRQYQRGIMSYLVRDVMNKGYRYYDWNCSSGDAAGNTMPTSYIIRNATNGKANHLNILFHDSKTKTTTVAALPTVIKYYLSRGYTFKPITDLSVQVHHGVNN
ncbi:polysaccharide deacetylase [Ligilactobacillus ceti]|uniref:NodB homology domain-containing protein n=1 Tax=Ligilactobacillus ceti DSM 22408 TaxID=1122146 RepID=A0A0R2KI67_9LACO|nr:polysaccharide deacetylase [Ligilactobacillus ceti]KRN89065.1 hypothetical protein IV53_GL001038 [Ligilactobacillus ceti DSM 22408]